MSYIPGGGFNVKTTITTSGTWTCPAGVSWALLTIWAAGGGGYLITDNSSYLNAGGGGGGAWKQLLIPVTPGTVYYFVIGAGGSGYVNLSNTAGTATAGGNSYMYTIASSTTLAAAISSTASSGYIDLTAVTGVSSGAIIQVDSEQMLVLSPGAAGGSNTWVIRGWNSTTITTHTNGATVNVLNILALVQGGAAGTSGTGGNGGGGDASTGGGANNSSSAGAGTGKPALSGRAGVGGGGGATVSGSSYNLAAGNTESPFGFVFPNYQVSWLTYSGGNTCSGGASWGPGNPGGDFSVSVVLSPTPNTGGGGGGGTGGSSGGALLAYQST